MGLRNICSTIQDFNGLLVSEQMRELFIKEYFTFLAAYSNHNVFYIMTNISVCYRTLDLKNLPPYFIYSFQITTRDIQLADALGQNPFYMPTHICGNSPYWLRPDASALAEASIIVDNSVSLETLPPNLRDHFTFDLAENDTSSVTNPFFEKMLNFESRPTGNLRYQNFSVRGLPSVATLVNYSLAFSCWVGVVLFAIRGSALQAEFIPPVATDLSQFSAFQAFLYNLPSSY